MVTELWAFFNSRIRPRVNRVYQLETRDALLGRILDAADHIRNSQLKLLELLARFTTERQPVLRPAEAFSKTIFKHR